MIKKLATSLPALILLVACNNTTTQRIPDGSALANQAMASKDWRCEGDINLLWRCTDSSKEDRKTYNTRPAAIALPTKSRVLTETSVRNDLVNTAPDNVADTAIEKKQVTHNTQLLDYPDKYFVVQLLAAKHKQSLAQYLKRHPQISTQQISISQNGNTLHLLILDVYPTYAAAKTAINTISPPLENKPWIRPLGPLKKHLPITATD